MTASAPFLLVGALILYVPGLLVLLACRARSPRLLIGVAPVATLGLLQLGALLSTVTPLHIRGASAVLTAALAITVTVLEVRARTDGAIRAAARRTAVAVRTSPAAIAVGGALLVGAVALATSTWLRGFDGLDTPPQEHDTVTHTLLTAYIARNGEASPFDVMPVDLASGGWVRFYPAGLHTFAALLAQLRGDDAIAGFNGATLLLLAVAGPVTLAAAAAGIEALRTRPAFAGLSALLAVGLYRPYFQLAHDAGILPFAVGLAMSPALAICLLAIGRRDWQLTAVTALVALGLFTLHPSIAIIATLVAVMVLAACLIAGPGRVWLRERWLTLAATAAAAAVLVAPWALASASVAASVAGYPEQPPSVSAVEAFRWVAGFFYGGFIDVDDEHFQLGFAILFWMGAVGCVITRGLRPLVAVWFVWALAAFLFAAGQSGLPVLAQLGQLLFNSWVRIMAVSNVLAPVVAALGLGALAERVVALLARRAPRRGRPRGWLAALPALLAALVAVSHLAISGWGYHDTDVRAVAERYGDPEFFRITPDERAAFAVLAQQPGIGRVLNNANDGSTFLYVYEGIPVINIYPLGMPEARHGIYLMEHLNDIETDPVVGCLIARWNITDVVVSLSSPPIGARGAPDRWVRRDMFSYAPGFFGLTELPEFSTVTANADTAVFRIDPRVAADADRTACTADPEHPLPGGADD